MSALKSLPRTTPQRTDYQDFEILMDTLTRTINSFQLAHATSAVKFAVELKMLTSRGTEALKSTIEPDPHPQDPLPGMGVDALPDWDELVQDYERRHRDEE